MMGSIMLPREHEAVWSDLVIFETLHAGQGSACQRRLTHGPACMHDPQQGARYETNFEPVHPFANSRPCVQARAVRASAGSNLGQLSALSMRVDMLTTDLAVTAGTAPQVSAGCWLKLLNMSHQACMLTGTLYLGNSSWIQMVLQRREIVCSMRADMLTTDLASTAGTAPQVSASRRSDDYDGHIPPGLHAQWDAGLAQLNLERDGFSLHSM